MLHKLSNVGVKEPPHHMTCYLWNVWDYVNMNGLIWRLMHTTVHFACNLIYFHSITQVPSYKCVAFQKFICLTFITQNSISHTHNVINSGKVPTQPMIKIKYSSSWMNNSRMQYHNETEQKNKFEVVLLETKTGRKWRELLGTLKGCKWWWHQLLSSTSLKISF